MEVLKGWSKKKEVRVLLNAEQFAKTQLGEQLLLLSEDKRNRAQAQNSDLARTLLTKDTDTAGVRIDPAHSKSYYICFT